MKIKFKVLTKEKARNYVTILVRSFDILKEYAAEESVDLDLNQSRIAHIIKKYDDMLFCLKKHTMKMNNNDYIDSHKISAIFLASILHHKDIVFSNHDAQPSSMTVYPHIYLSFVFATTLMEKMYNEKHKNSEYLVFNLNKTYIKEFVKLIFANEQAILKPATSIECNNSYKGLFFLSHLFYFIEKVADKQAD